VKAHAHDHRQPFAQHLCPGFEPMVLGLRASGRCATRAQLPTYLGGRARGASGRLVGADRLDDAGPLGDEALLVGMQLVGARRH
jgi:hypothetical protein